MEVIEYFPYLFLRSLNIIKIRFTCSVSLLQFIWMPMYCLVREMRPQGNIEDNPMLMY